MQRESTNGDVMLKIKDSIVVRRPLDLANALGEHLLMVGGDGKPMPGTEVPDEIYVRYDTANELLYIDTRVFAWMDITDTLTGWRNDPQYCGSLKKRMSAGTGRTEPPQGTVCFDLSENPDNRDRPIRPRGGRPLKIERVRVRMNEVEKVNEKVLDFHRRIAELQSRYEDHPLLDEAVALMDEAKDVLKRAADLLVEGKRRGPDRRPRPKRGTAPTERIKLKALDGFLSTNIERVHRILKKTVVENGKPRWVEKQIRPKDDPASWVARYEDVAEMGKAPYKQLFIPLALLKAYGGLENYKADYRYVGKGYRRVGEATAYCVVFDMARPAP